MSKADFNEFCEQGFLIKKSFFEKQMINDLFDELTQTHEKLVKQLKYEIKMNFIKKNDIALENDQIKYLKNAVLYFDSIKNIVDSELIKLASFLIGDNIIVEAVELHQKYPGTSQTPPHQDNFYFCLENAKSLTAYIPLNAQERENGALAVIPKSHNLVYEHYPSSIAGFSSGITLSNQQLSEVNHYSLEVGDLSLHHCNIVHLAPPNTSKVPRINIAIRFRAKNEKESPEKLLKYNKFLEKSSRII